MPLVFIMRFAIGLNEEWTNKELKKKISIQPSTYQAFFKRRDVLFEFLYIP